MKPNQTNLKLLKAHFVVAQSCAQLVSPEIAASREDFSKPTGARTALSASPKSLPTNARTRLSVLRKNRRGLRRFREILIECNSALLSQRLRRAALAITFFAALSLAEALHGQSFDAGSNGSLGDVVITTNTTLKLPDDGKLHFKNLTVNSGVTLSFNRNVHNTPVFILSQSNVVVDGTISVDGANLTVNTGGLGGPGGFDGGKPGFGAEVPPGFGYGPGGGPAGRNSCNQVAGDAMSGSYGSQLNALSGSTYGNTLLIPMVGGSGPFDYITMGGMFTILKVRDELQSYADPGWYDNPPGTLSIAASASDLQRDAIDVNAAPKGDAGARTRYG